GPDERAEQARARPGEEDAIAGRHHLGLVLHAPEELEHLLGLARVVALIVLPQDFVSARLAFGGGSPFHRDRFHGGGADVHSDELHHPAFWATCSTRFAAWPAQPMCGTR